MKTLSNLCKYSFIFLALLMTACDKDDDATTDPDDDTTAAGAEFLTAKIDGVAFEAAQDPAVIVGAQIGSSGSIQVLVFQGGTNAGETISISITNYDGPGTYVTGDSVDNASGANYITIDPLATWQSSFATAFVGGLELGEIVITSDDGEVVEGTFSFEGYNADDESSKMITEGKFKANIDM
ncbi:MAG: DUF6252 family protein [Gilvibacter sp.]